MVAVEPLLVTWLRFEKPKSPRMVNVREVPKVIVERRSAGVFSPIAIKVGVPRLTIDPSIVRRLSLAGS